MPNLTGNTALDVAIGLAFTYLLFSVLCSAIQEAIAGILDMRAATLEKGLRNLLDDNGEANEGGAPSATAAPAPTGTRNLTDEVLGHGLIRTTYRKSTLLWRRKRRGPSYIPPQTFSLALLDVIAPANAEAQSTNVRQLIATANIPAGTKSALLSLATGVATDRDHLRKLIEDWFNGAMDRVSGWYKRKTQIIICVLSLLVTVGLNVNTVSIAQRLANDDAVRAAIVQEAVKSVPAPGSSLQAVQHDITQAQKLGLPFGWSKAAGDPARPDLSHHFGRTIGGWLLSFLALSLGAPFWFDALNKLAGLRASGPKPKSAASASG